MAAACSSVCGSTSSQTTGSKGGPTHRTALLFLQIIACAVRYARRGLVGHKYQIIATIAVAQFFKKLEDHILAILIRIGGEESLKGAIRCDFFPGVFLHRSSRLSLEPRRPGPESLAASPVWLPIAAASSSTPG